MSLNYAKHLFCLLSRLLVLLFCVGSLAAQDSSDPAINRDVGTVRLNSPQPGVLEASWDVPEEAPDDYRIKWAKVGESYLTWTDNSGNAFPTNSSYTITGLDGGVRYKVQVRPRYDSGPRPWSDEVEIQVMASPTDTSTPTNTPHPDCGALESIYDALGGDNWRIGRFGCARGDEGDRENDRDDDQQRDSKRERHPLT